jgi:hypothetical protein
MSKFTVFLKSIIYEVNQYSHSLDPSIKKFPEEFKKFYNLDFSAYLNRKGTTKANEVEKEIKKFEEYCLTQSLDTLVNFLNWAKIGIEEAKREDIIVPLGGNPLDKIDEIFATGTIHRDTQEIVRKSLTRYEEMKEKQISIANREMLSLKNKLRNEYDSDKITYKEFQKKRGELTKKFEASESAAKAEYWSRVRNEISNLVSGTGTEKIESAETYKYRITRLENIIKEAQDRILSDMLNKQSVLLSKKEPIKVESNEIQIDPSLPNKINNVRRKWNNVIKIFSDLSKNVLDKSDKRGLLKTVPKEYLIFAPLFFNDSLGEFTLDNDITVNQYNDILNKSFLNDLLPEFKFYLEEIKKNTSRERRLVIQKITSILKKAPSEFKNVSIGSQLYMSKMNTPVIKEEPKIEEISIDEIESLIDSIRKISESDIEGSFKSGMFGSYENKISKILKSLNKIKLISDSSTKELYKDLIQKEIDDFEFRMLTVADDLLNYLKNKKDKNLNDPKVNPPLSRDDIKLSDTLNGFDGILYRIKIEDLKNELKEI